MVCAGIFVVVSVGIVFWGVVCSVVIVDVDCGCCVVSSASCVVGVLLDVLLLLHAQRMSAQLKKMRQVHSVS